MRSKHILEMKLKNIFIGSKLSRLFLITENGGYLLALDLLCQGNFSTLFYSDVKVPVYTDFLKIFREIPQIRRCNFETF